MPNQIKYNEWMLTILWMSNLVLLIFSARIFLVEFNKYSIDVELGYSKFLAITMFLLIGAGQLALIRMLSHSSISKQKLKLPKEYTQIGWLVLKTQHHPNCGCFENHEVFFQNKLFICGGCFGTIIGLLISILLLIIVNIVPELMKPLWEVLFYLGICLIQLSLMKFLFFTKKLIKSKMRFFLNILLPIGINLILIGSYLYDLNVLHLLILILISVFETILRLIFTKLDHETTINCPKGLIH